MVISSTSLGRSGMHDWLLQRVSALILGIYSVFIIGFFLQNPSVDYPTWKALFANTTFKIFTILALLSIVLHAWIGLWTVSTDYIKHTATRLSVQLVVIFTCLSLFVWGIMAIWGN